MADYAIKRGATDPPYLAQLVDANGDGIDLTTASGVTIRIQRGTDATITFTGAIVTALTGNVSLTWAVSDTDITEGVYNVEWIVDYGGGRSEVVPSKGYAQIEITRILA